MRRFRAIILLATISAVVCAFAPLTRATDNTDWSPLVTMIQATVPLGPAQASLLGAVDEIEFQETTGSYENVVAAYSAFVDLVVGYYDTATLTKPQGDAVLGSFQDASEAHFVEVLREFRLELVLFKKCAFSECTLDGSVCATFAWQYWDKDTGLRGGGQNCLGR